MQLAITELCYAELLENYRAKHWSDVIESAELLGDYEDADWYGYLAALHKYDYCTEEDIGYLKPYLGYDDVKDIILQSSDTAWYFLLGKWTCNYGFLQFSERKDSDHLLYNLPAPNFGNSWKLKNGVMSFYYEKDPSETKQAYRFTIIDADTIEVYCFQNNKTYTLDKK